MFICLQIFLMWMAILHIFFFLYYNNLIFYSKHEFPLKRNKIYQLLNSEMTCWKNVMLLGFFQRKGKKRKKKKYSGYNIFYKNRNLRCVNFLKNINNFRCFAKNMIMETVVMASSKLWNSCYFPFILEYFLDNIYQF